MIYGKVTLLRSGTCSILCYAACCHTLPFMLLMKLINNKGAA